MFKKLSAINSIYLSLIPALSYLFFFTKKAIAIPQTSSTQFVAQTSINPQNMPETMVLSRFKVVGNNVIPQAEIDAVLKPYLFRPISFMELIAAQQAVTQLYVDRGYFTTGAFIPPQTIENRTVKIEVVEGTIGEIKIIGLKKLRPEYIRSRIAIASQAPLHQDKLLEALQRLQLNPLIKNLSAELSQGIKPGESFLKLKIEEADSFDLKLALDNDLTPSVGSLRGRISVDEGNLLGFGDRFQASYAQSEGSKSLERLEYLAPIGARGTYLRTFHSRNENQIIVEPFTSLDLENSSLGYGITLIQNAIDKPARKLVLAFGFTHQNTQFTIEDKGFFNLARGLNDDGRSIVSSLNFIQEYSDRSPTSVFSATSQFSVGIDAFGSVINNDGQPDSKYLSWLGRGQYLTAISPKTNLSLGGIIQLADSPLFNQEQFVVGGATSVRGYSRGITQGDNGFSLYAELNNTVWQIPKWDFSVELSPFFDFGRIWNTDNFPIETNTLASVGIDARISIKEDLTATIGIGIPLIDPKLPERNSLQDDGIYFSLSTKLF